MSSNANWSSNLESILGDGDAGSRSASVSSKMIEVTDSLLSRASAQEWREPCEPRMSVEYTEELLMDGFCICSGFTGHLCEGVLPDIIAWRPGGGGRGLSASTGDWVSVTERKFLGH
jgi:hypothetical protein